MKIYTDASFDNKKQIAGIGIVIKDGIKERTHSNWIKCRTVNAAELIAIYIGGVFLDKKGCVYTDSQTAISYINDEIKDKPRTKEQYLNHMECKYWAYKIRKRHQPIKKIKAHEKTFQTHSMGNRMADLMALNGRSKFYEKAR